MPLVCHVECFGMRRIFMNIFMRVPIDTIQPVFWTGFYRLSTFARLSYSERRHRKVTHVLCKIDHVCAL